MKRILYLIIPLFFVFSFGKIETFIPRNFNEVIIENIIIDSLLNVRALELKKPSNFTFATSNGWIGGSTINEIEEIADNIIKLKFDTIVPNFRSLAVTSKNIFALSIANPALLYKVNKDTIQIVYKEYHDKVFYDSMEFWNDKEGIAIGDSMDGCLSVIVTRDGGNSWTKLTCNQLPTVNEGEGAFAASDTNIAIVGNKTWVATTAGRVYFSKNKGRTWEVFDTPIIKEKETEGIYSIAFYDEFNGFAIGGDYTKSDDNQLNKIRTNDGGKTWQLVSQGQGPGYRSCVQYIPNSEGKELVAIGFRGIDYSNDSGNTWKHLSDEGFYTLRFLNDSTAYAAGNGRISKLTFRD